MSALVHEGCPPHWHNSEHIPICIASGCSRTFESLSAFRCRIAHWHSQQNCSLRTISDHQILLGMGVQRECPYCNLGQSGVGVYVLDLFRHEELDHESHSMSTIEGFVALVRRGHNVSATDATKNAIFRRMVQIITDSPMLALLSQYLTFRMTNLERKTLDFEDLKCILSPPVNRPNGLESPYYEPIKPEDFLSYLKPEGDERAVWWEPVWTNLRSRYADGRI